MRHSERQTISSHHDRSSLSVFYGVTLANRRTAKKSHYFLKEVHNNLRFLYNVTNRKSTALNYCKLYL